MFSDQAQVKSYGFFLLKRAMIHMSFPLLLSVALMLNDSIHLAVDSAAHETRPVYFPSELLQHPRDFLFDFPGMFHYKEISVFKDNPSENEVVLENGYAEFVIGNPGEIKFDRSSWAVAKVDVVFTKYPLHKEQWRTNYYDLLAWRLKALFELDPSLNNPSIEWGLILQTAATNEPDAKKLFHGIVLHLEPIAYTVETTEEEYEPSQREFTPIENGGFLFREQRNPDMFRSRYNFEPTPGREPRRNMDPSDLKCPRWH